MPEYEGDLIIGTPTMRKWETTIKLEVQGSSIRVGAAKLKIIHICKRSQLHKEGGSTSVTDDLVQSLLNDPQCPKKRELTE